MQDEPIEAAIGAGLEYLARRQLKDGGFASFSSPSLQVFEPAKTYRTNFVPALILSAISGTGGTAAKAVRDSLAAYLLKQTGEQGSFNYWSRADKRHELQPYPDDLDDTFCALSALCLHNPKLIDEAVLTRAVKILLGTETKVGGPYRTWLVPPGSGKVWQDVDLAVNSNVAYFLSLVSRPLPNLVAFIDRAIINSGLESPYYPSAYPLVYYVSRGYSGNHRAKLTSFARSLRPETPLETAMITASLLRLGSIDQAEKVKQLLGGQSRDGSWPAAAFCLDQAIKGQTYYNGAAALTTALALEALELYRRLPDAGHRPPVVKTGKPDRITPAVLALAKARCRELPPPLRSGVLKALLSIAAGSNGSEIIQLPAGFNKSLLKPLKKDPGFFDNLSLSNLFGWLAYTIYDDFYDGSGRINLLPAANVALRSSWDGFLLAAPQDDATRRFLTETFDMIDNANAWELAHCRFRVADGRIEIQPLPKYHKLEKLAERSIGHALPALVTLLNDGYGTGSAAFKRARRALFHYLIVRQLNDDVHDWQTDLENGHISYVVARLLTDLSVRPGDYELSDLLKSARRQFWHRTLPELCGEMRTQARQSRRALAASGLFTDDNVIIKLLERLEASVDEAIASRQQALSFLKHYNKQSVA
jgi:prenyltransferase/squalene oxidase-like repeat protein